MLGIIAVLKTTPPQWTVKYTQGDKMKSLLGKAESVWFFISLREGGANMRPGDVVEYVGQNRWQSRNGWSVVTGNVLHRKVES